MNILCDTSGILLLLRICPDMFIDPRFECVTIQEVHDEIYQKQKFKDRYPWRIEFKSKIKCLKQTEIHDKQFEALYKMINFALGSGIVDDATGHDFDLSKVDKNIVACALAHGYKIASGDAGLCRYAAQEFGEIFKGSVSALDVLNGWLEKDLLQWDNEKQAFLNDWLIQKERAQPDGAIRRFQELTCRQYPR